MNIFKNIYKGKQGKQCTEYSFKNGIMCIIMCMFTVCYVYMAEITIKNP